MSASGVISIDMREFLARPETQRTLNQRLTAIQRDLTTSIKEAAQFAELSEPQVRYIEAKGLLHVERSSHGTDMQNPAPGRRRYGLSDVRRLVLISMLEQSFSLGQIAGVIDELDREFLQQPSVAQDEPTVTERITAAERRHFNRFFVSRSLYLALRLLGDRSISGSMGIFLPVPGAVPGPQPASAADLERLGRVLWGWLGRDHPFCTFLTRTIRLDHPELYSLQSVDQLARPEGEPATGAYLVQEKNASLLAGQAASSAERGRMEYAYTAAWRILAALQRSYGRDSEPYWEALRPGNDGMEYSSHQFRSAPILGDSILQRLAEAIVHLGGRDHKDTDRWRWQFSVILEPAEYDRPIQETSLTVRAQSTLSPHIIGVTTLQPDRDPGISLDAFQSGTIIKRNAISTADPRIAYQSAEGAIKSAIAVPVQSLSGERIAVIYVVSTAAHAFSEADEILLRVAGRMVEEAIIGMRIRDLPLDQLTNLITKPEHVDTFFSEFYTENDFIHDLGNCIASMHGHASGQATGQSEAPGRENYPLDEDLRFLSLIAIDIDGHSAVAAKYGNSTAHDLVHAVGKRILDNVLMQGTDAAGFNISRTARIYKVRADQFFLLLPGISLDHARELALHLHRVLGEPYRVIPALQATPKPGMDMDEWKKNGSIHVRVGVISYDREVIRKQLATVRAATSGDAECANPDDFAPDSEYVAEVRARISRSLEASLQLGRDLGGGQVVSWDDDQQRLIPWPLLVS